jgi:predicted phage gp36 major capsid-like protein
MAGFFNKLFPNWKPKTILGKIIKGATAVLAPVASALGIKNTVILGAEVGAAMTGIGALGVAVKTVVSSVSKVVTKTIDEVSEVATNVVNSINRPTTQQQMIAQQESIKPLLIILGIGIVLILIFRED